MRCLRRGVALTMAELGISCETSTSASRVVSRRSSYLLFLAIHVQLFFNPPPPTPLLLTCRRRVVLYVALVVARSGDYFAPNAMPT